MKTVISIVILFIVVHFTSCKSNPTTNNTSIETTKVYSPGWVKINSGIKYVSTFGLAVRGKDIFVTTSQGYIYRSTNNGELWTIANTSPEDIPLKSLIECDNILYGVDFSHNVYRSSDNGTTWTKINIGLSTNYVEMLEVCDNSIFAVTVGREVYRTDDEGDNWIKSDSGIVESVSSLIVDGLNLYAGTTKGSIYKSTNKGESWFVYTTVIKERGIPSLIASGTTLFATTTTTGDSIGVFRSTNSGVSWSLSLSDKSYIREVFEFAIKDTNIVAGTNTGVYFSTNTGDSWSFDTTMGISLRIYDLEVKDKYLFATTGNGVWRHPF